MKTDLLLLIIFLFAYFFLCVAAGKYMRYKQKCEDLHQIISSLERSSRIIEQFENGDFEQLKDRVRAASIMAYKIITNN